MKASNKERPNHEGKHLSHNGCDKYADYHEFLYIKASNTERPNMMDLAADDESKITTHPANKITQIQSKVPD